jgi:hypothetical protein
MKKMRIVVPVLLLVCAGMVLTGCPSDPEPGPPSLQINDPDYTLTDGKINIPLPSITVTNGGEYDVIFDIGQIEDPLLGCHFKGRLLYVHEERTYLLTEALDAFPNIIAKFPRKYRWTFKAGEWGDDTTADSAAKWGYTVPDNKTVPSDATFVFQLFAMTPKWKYFGDSDAENYQYIRASKDTEETERIDYKGRGIVCRIKEAGPLVFRPKAALPGVNGGTINANGGSDANSAGQGNIEEGEWEKVKNAPLGSLMRFNCTVNVGAVGSDAREPGWGFGGIGGNVNGEFPKVREQNQELTLVIPKGTAAGSQTFNIDIFVEDVLASSNKDWSFVRTNDSTPGNQKINSITIYTP